VEGVESMLRIVKKRPFSGTTAATIESQASPRRHTSCQLALLGRPRGQCAGISHEGIHGSTGTNGPQAAPWGLWSRFWPVGCKQAWVTPGFCGIRTTSSVKTLSSRSAGAPVIIR
jgi:hypothetical protein